MLEEIEMRQQEAERQRLEALGVEPQSVRGDGPTPAWLRSLEIGAQGDPRQN